MRKTKAYRQTFAKGTVKFSQLQKRHGNYSQQSSVLGNKGEETVEMSHTQDLDGSTDDCKENLQESSRLALLESEIENLQSRNRTLSKQVLFLEKENQELRERLQTVEKDYGDLQATERERRLHTSEMGAINRSQRRRIVQLQEDMSALQNSHKAREWAKESMHNGEVERLREENQEALRSQESLFEDTLGKVKAESEAVTRGLREESREKTELFHMALQYAQQVQSTNLMLTAACLSGRRLEYVRDGGPPHRQSEDTLAILDAASSRLDSSE